MTKEIAISQDSVLATYNDEQRTLLRNEIAKGCSESELIHFLTVCRSKGLNPIDRQIYAIKRGGSMTIQTGIDGFRSIADRTETYAPGAETFRNVDGDLEATVSVFKLVAGTWREFSATAYLSEYSQPQNGIWKKMPRTMLAKCAESKAIRKGWPTQLGGLYTSEEMQQAEPVPMSFKAKAIDVTDKTETTKEKTVLTYEALSFAFTKADSIKQLDGYAVLAKELSEADQNALRDEYRICKEKLSLKDGKHSLKNQPMPQEESHDGQ